jgi:5-methylcytosine-specific restriction endonuclease McrA
LSRPFEFSKATQLLALARQKNRCAVCGTRITTLGEAGRAQHAYGEGARAHHIRHVKFGGTAILENCVILCQSCHYTMHEGGNYRFGTVVFSPADFPHYHG